VARDEALEDRIEELLPDGLALEKKRMFGGVGYLDRGNLCFGVSADHLTVRVGKEAYDDVLERSGARPMVMRGRPMPGWVQVDPKGYATESDLTWWITAGLEGAASLPPK